MADNTRIQWTDRTWNPWQGCTKVSPGCDQCYMYRDKKRYGDNPAVVVRSKDPTFWRPFKKGKTGWKSGDRVFVCSWSDFFHPAADNWRPAAWRIIRERPDLIFQILTKRPQYIAKRLPQDWGEGWPNVWLGATVEDQPRANERIPILLPIPAAVHFVSIEPMLGEVDLDGTPAGQAIGPCGQCGKTKSNPECEACMGIPSLDWVIVGGETGPGARPMQTDWLQSVFDQCNTAGVPFFYKKAGDHLKRLDPHIEESINLPRQFPEVRR